ncbi:uncharacterized protein THITE_2127999 [Thermothielavioides terrestris NRRL 8126]|uniref:Uncharacterized protein n=1 Tax=Thermothielavioides terrestris (strain ATCC 38088 / NRRL 8126) TaxID=578455 RepID=G2R2I0_THETT|nr:uncharacterized protein THITE_2127999 [Thermothielavioides terrestris NRRL 8126]AEO65853.1 hypothetical protein THITE_2127999 [Thermothielavioides terrestris NRRL 8126]
MDCLGMDDQGGPALSVVQKTLLRPCDLFWAHAARHHCGCDAPKWMRGEAPGGPEQLFALLRRGNLMRRQTLRGATLVSWTRPDLLFDLNDLDGAGPRLGRPLAAYEFMFFRDSRLRRLRSNYRMYIQTSVATRDSDFDGMVGSLETQTRHLGSRTKLCFRFTYCQVLWTGQDTSLVCRPLTAQCNTNK